MVSTPQSLQKPSLSAQFSEVIHKHTDDQWFHTRIYESLSSFTKAQGYAKTGCLAGAALVVETIMPVLGYMSIEGSIRSIMEVAHDSSTLEALRPLGDAAGWAPLTMFMLYVMKDVYDRTIGEGEYYKVAQLCEDWMIKNIDAIQSTPSFRKEMYADIKETLKNYSNKCFSSRSVAAMRLKTWKIFKHTSLDDPKANGKAYKREIKIKSIVKRINESQQAATASSNLLSRCIESYKIIIKRTFFIRLCARLFGIVLPILLSSVSALGIPGDAGLIHQIYVNATNNQESLSDRGHVSEWIMNLVDSIAFAYFLFVWYFLSESDLSSTHKIYAKELDLLQKSNTKKDYHTLKEIGREELAETALRCSHLKTGMELNFEPYKKNIRAAVLAIPQVSV